MKKRCIILILFFTGFLTTMPASAQQSRHISSTDSIYPVSGFALLFCDSAQTCTFDSVITPKYKKQFRSFSDCRQTNISGGNIWLRIPLQYAINTDSRWLLTFGFFRNVTVYYPDNKGSYNAVESGYGLPFHKQNEKRLSYSGRAVWIPLYASQPETELFIKIQDSQNQTIGNIRLQSEREFFEFLSRRNIFQGIFQGILLIMIVYHLAIFLYNRDKVYLYYVLFMIAISVSFLVAYSFFSFLNTGIFFGSKAYIVLISNNLISPFYFSFSKHFLHLKKRYPPYNRILRFWIKFRYISIIIIALIMFFTNRFNLCISITNWLFIIEISFNIYFSIDVLIRKDIIARYFSVGSLLIYFGALLTILGLLGFVEYGFASQLFLQVAIVLQLLVFALGLGYRISVSEKEKQQAQERLISQLEKNEKLQTKVNRELEGKVKERTLLIEKQKEELRAALDNLKKAQTKLVQSEKMISLGQLTAGIAHEINNPLNFISSNINPLRKDVAEIQLFFKKLGEFLKSNSEISSDKIENEMKKREIQYVTNEIDVLLKGIEEGALRTKEIILGLRNFSRLDENTLKLADIHQGLQSTLTLLSNRIKNKITIKKEFGNIPNIECYPGEINQVFMNILANAVDAINDKGEIRIKTELIHVDLGENKQQIKITISDNGQGMTIDEQERIFEPFFTTKEIGKGTGLGLSVVYGIISKHHGTIDVFSRLHKGSSFIIRIPVKQNN